MPGTTSLAKARRSSCMPSTFVSFKNKKEKLRQSMIENERRGSEPLIGFYSKNFSNIGTTNVISQPNDFTEKVKDGMNPEFH